MPTTLEDYQTIQDASSQTAASLKASALTFEDDVMARVRDARQKRGMSLLASEMGEVTSQLPTYGVQLRDRTQDVNPLTVDQMSGAARGQLLGELTSLGTQAEEQYGTIEEMINAGANQMLAQAELATATGGAGGGLGNVFSNYGVPVGQQASITDRLMLLTDLKETRELMGEEQTLIQSYGDLMTGPISGSFLSPAIPGESVRNRIDRLISDIKKQKYGVAFTKEEIKQSRKWAPGSSRQESTNIKRLDDLIGSKIIELSSILRPYGVTEQEINSLLTTGRADPQNPLLNSLGLDEGWSDTGRVR